MLTGESKYIDVLRKQLDILYDHKKVENGKTLLPQMYGDPRGYLNADLARRPRRAGHPPGRLAVNENEVETREYRRRQAPYVGLGRRSGAARTRLQPPRLHNPWSAAIGPARGKDST